MHSLSDHLLHLSLGEPSNPTFSKPTSTPAGISPKPDVLTDIQHEELDKRVFHALDDFQQMKREPNLALLLFVITGGDERLKTLTSPEAEIFLQVNPSVVGILRNAWQAGSFKEVRQLGAFPRSNCVTIKLTSPRTIVEATSTISGAPASACFF
jgi:hypothetical protein